MSQEPGPASDRSPRTAWPEPAGAVRTSDREAILVVAEVVVVTPTAAAAAAAPTAPVGAAAAASAAAAPTVATGATRTATAAAPTVTAAAAAGTPAVTAAAAATCEAAAAAATTCEAAAEAAATTAATEVALTWGGTGTATTTTAATTLHGGVAADAAAVERLAVHGLERRATRWVVRERHEAEATAPTSLAILDHDRIDHFAKGFKRCAQRRIVRRPRQSANKQLHGVLFLFSFADQRGRMVVLPDPDPVTSRARGGVLTTLESYQ